MTPADSKRLPLLAIAIFLSTASTGSPAEIEGVTFIESYRLGKSSIHLNNVGLMRYKVVVKALVAGLYLPAGSPPARALSDVPKRLEIEYFWSVKGKDIAAASEKLLADNVDEHKLRRLRPQIDRMHSLYVDVRPGDRYALTYLPGRGTMLSLNGEFRGLIPGTDFAAAYFSIWLGKRPMSASLKDQLLSARR